METVWYFFIFFILLLLLIYLWQLLKQEFNDFRNRRKGHLAERCVVKTLNEWSKRNDIRASARREPMIGNYQSVDVLYNNSKFVNLAIEVKYRTIDWQKYLRFDSISRFDKNGRRQSTRQLSFISKTDRLGLYAFVFSEFDYKSVYFLPHYVIEQMINRGGDGVVVEKIRTHEDVYFWDDQNEDFGQYLMDK